MVRSLWEKAYQFPKNICPVLPLLCIDIKVFVLNKTYETILMEALFIIPLSWKQPGCSPIGR